MTTTASTRPRQAVTGRAREVVRGGSWVNKWGTYLDRAKVSGTNSGCHWASPIRIGKTVIELRFHEPSCFVTPPGAIVALVRQNNQDSVYAGPSAVGTPPTAMGGHAAGEVASKLVIQAPRPAGRGCTER